nr:MAG TPA: hypothetical protein [Caudoviricetes sp.]
MSVIVWLINSAITIQQFLTIILPMKIISSPHPLV